MSYTDLHNHLYGSISAEMLYDIGKQNPNPRWNLFIDLHKTLYGEEIKTQNFFEDYKDMDRFKNLYFFNKRAPFIEFQSKFNLIIALCRFDEEEIRYVAKEVVIEHAGQEVEFVEYRIMYAPNASQAVYNSKTLAACEGLYLGETSSNNKIKARLVVSLHRDGNYLEQYTWLKKLMQESKLVNKYLVGIDFCYIEEGYPPSEKRNFFKQVLAGNEEQPSSSLSILYHVGESFMDKTPKSTVRWIAESALWGVHRLGHCIALGINPETFANKTILEKVSERLGQIEFEIQNYEEIRAFGITQDYSELLKEKDFLQLRDSEDTVNFVMNKKYIDELYTFQEFVISLIRDKSQSIIESCPTSNLYIGMLPEMKAHPIRRFIDRGLRVTISSDDPGIFDTTLKKEYELAAYAGLSLDELTRIKDLSPNYTSEKLSGRKNE